MLPNLKLILLIYRVFRKNCLFFTIHCNPSLTYNAVRDLESSQRNAGEQSLLLAGNFLYNQQQLSSDKRVVANFREILEKNTIFNEHPVIDNFLTMNRKLYVMKKKYFKKLVNLCQTVHLDLGFFPSISVMFLLSKDSVL